MKGLEFLGLDENATKVYRILLQGGEHSQKSLIDRLEVPEGQVSSALRALSAASLVYVPVNVHEIVHVIDPKLAFSAALAQHRAEIARFHQEIESMEGEFVKLAAKYEKMRAQRLQQEVEILGGHGAIQARMPGLMASAEREVLSVQAIAESGFYGDTGKEIDDVLISRGVRVRRIYRDSMRNNLKVYYYMKWLSSTGGEVRTIPVIPFTAIVLDSRTALLPLSAQADGEDGQTIVMHQPDVISVLRFAFQKLWESAQAFDEPSTHDETELTFPDRELLRLLADGLTDESAARKMGISLRTVRRMSANLMGKLEARSRFQAGYQVSQRGWLLPAADRYIGHRLAPPGSPAGSLASSATPSP